MKLDEVHLLSDIYKKDPSEITEAIKKSGINLPGLYQELEMSSRFIDTHKDISYGDIPVQLHSHSFCEVIYCTSNSGTQYLVDTKRYSLQRGDVIMVPPGVGHRPLYPSQLAEPYQRIVLWLSAEFISALQQIVPYDPTAFKDKIYLLRTAGTPWEQIGEYFHKGIKESQNKEDGWEVALCGNTMQLLTIFWRGIHATMDKPAKTEKPELLDNVVSYIETHLDKKITLPDIAARFYVSESTISQTFQKKMHVSFYHYVTQRRLIAAKSMILEENNLETLANKVGFNDYSAFFRAFKKGFGISPKEYRNLIAESQQNLL